MDWVTTFLGLGANIGELPEMVERDFLPQSGVCSPCFLELSHAGKPRGTGNFDSMGKSAADLHR